MLGKLLMISFDPHLLNLKPISKKIFIIIDWLQRLSIGQDILLILVKWTHISDCSILESAAKDGFSVNQNVTVCSLLDNRISYWSAVPCWFVYFCDFLKDIKEPYLMKSVQTLSYQVKRKITSFHIMLRF